MRTAWDATFLVFLAVLLVEAAARIGAGVISLCSQRRFLSLERFGLGLLLGWGSVGMAFLGLALTGLFFPAVLLVCFLALLAGSRVMWSQRVLLVEVPEVVPIRPNSSSIHQAWLLTVAEYERAQVRLENMGFDITDSRAARFGTIGELDGSAAPRPLPSGNRTSQRHSPNVWNYTKGQ